MPCQNPSTTLLARSSRSRMRMSAAGSIRDAEGVTGGQTARGRRWVQAGITRKVVLGREILFTGACILLPRVGLSSLRPFMKLPSAKTPALSRWAGGILALAFSLFRLEVCQAAEQAEGRPANLRLTAEERAWLTAHPI